MKRKGEQKDSLLKRGKVFSDFWEQKKFQDVSVDVDKADQLTRVLDKVVIVLEGGNENDFKVRQNLLYQCPRI